MLGELGASQSGYSGLVSSSTESHANTGHGAENLWKERKGASVRFGADKEDGVFPLACQVKFWVMGFRRDYMFRRT